MQVYSDEDIIAEIIITALGEAEEEEGRGTAECRDVGTGTEKLKIVAHIDLIGIAFAVDNEQFFLVLRSIPAHLRAQHRSSLTQSTVDRFFGHSDFAHTCITCL